MIRIATATYGWQRAPAHVAIPTNSVNLTNGGSVRGARAVADGIKGATFVDYSPLLDPGVDWAFWGSIPERLEPCDLLFVQAGAAGLPIMRRAFELNPACRLVVQRDSTCATTHHRLMKEAMKARGIEWRHFYDDPENIKRDVEEYALADRIFVLSRWVLSTFVDEGWGDKTVQFASQLVVPGDYLWEGKKPRFPFAVCSVGQLGLRKGTFDLLDAWEIFHERCPNSILRVAGLPEHGAPPALNEALDRAFARVADKGVERLNWVDFRNMRGVYAASHVLCEPSWEDGGTMVGPEAALAGCAIVATVNAGIDILDSAQPKDCVVGVEVAVGDPHAIAGALLAMSMHRDYVEEMGARARQQALERDADAYAKGFARELGRCAFEWFPGLERKEE